MNLGMQFEIIGEVALAMLLGGIIGFEREVANKPAGFRTQMLVAGAAALLVGLGDALFSVGRAALPWAWRQAGVRRHLSPVGEAAEQGFQPQPRAELGTNPLQAQ